LNWLRMIQILAESLSGRSPIRSTLKGVLEARLAVNHDSNNLDRRLCGLYTRSQNCSFDEEDRSLKSRL
jgi:hypothetical protein